MSDDDAPVVIASYLRPEQAGMLRGLLESAGISATLRDDMLSSVHPFLEPVIGGAKLVVRAADEERAREIVRSVGLLPGSTPESPIEIADEEWSRTPETPPEPSRLRSKPAWPRRAIIAAPLLALVLALMRCVAGAAGR